MKRLIFFIGAIVAVFAALAIYLMIFHQPATAPDAAPVQRSSSVETEEATTDATITYTDEGFTPAKSKVTSGTEITVKNDSSRTLDFASDDHPTHHINSELNIGLIEPGESKSFTPQKGTWGYHDHLNANAVGEIIVE